MKLKTLETAGNNALKIIDRTLRFRHGLLTYLFEDPLMILSPLRWETRQFRAPAVEGISVSLQTTTSNFLATLSRNSVSASLATQFVSSPDVVFRPRR